MTIEELENKHEDLCWDMKSNFEALVKNHTNLSIEYTISVLEELETCAKLISTKSLDTILFSDLQIKIQELKQYLEK